MVMMALELDESPVRCCPYLVPLHHSPLTSWGGLIAVLKWPLVGYDILTNYQRMRSRAQGRAWLSSVCVEDAHVGGGGHLLLLNSL